MVQQGYDSYHLFIGTDLQGIWYYPFPVFAEDGEAVILDNRQKTMIDQFNALNREQQDALLAFLSTLK